MIYLFNKHLELTEVLKSPLSATMNRRLVGVDTLSVEESIKNLKVIEESSFAGAFLKNKFYIFKKDKHGSNNNKVYFTGINYAYDELANADVIKDRRLNNVTASVAISAAIQGTGWTLGTIQTTSAQTTNFYYETPLEAIKKVIELWQIEPDFYFDFDGKKITGRKIDVMQQRGRVTGERFVYGSDILEIVQEEDRSDIVTALYGRGKGEEVVDEEGETTGGYSRRITFADVEWKKSKGDPVDKPLGQEYVELPSATQAYGYPKGDGTFKPRFAVYINEQLEEPLEVLKETYRVLVERSRPLVTFSATVAKAGSYDLGDTNYIIRPDLGLSYEARIFEDEIDLLNPDRTKFKFGDYIQSGQAKRLREIKSYFDGLTDKISRVESDTNGKLIKISKDWYDALMEVKEGTFFSGSSYNYSLENGNPYGLPAGFYSFDAPLEGAPTGFLVIQGGKIGRGKVLPNGEWDFNLIGDEDGLTADAIVAGKIKAQFIEIGASSTFLEGYDPSKKANSNDVYTINQIDTKLEVLDGEISSKVSSNTYTSEKPTYGPSAPSSPVLGKLWVDTSVTPNLLKRWNGSSWAIINDTSALTQRVQQAEQKITPSAITGTVSSATNTNGEPLFAKTSEVKQTVNNWTAKFSQVGGENLFKDSEDLSNWGLYQGATMVSGYPYQVDVPEWSTYEAWRVRTTSNGTAELKAYKTISTDVAKLRGKPFTFSVYAKNNRTDASVRIGTLRFGSEILAPSEMKRVIISGENDTTALVQLQLSAQTADHYLDVTLYHPKFETGWVATDWNDYLYTGIIEADKDGLRVSRTGTEVSADLAYDGLRLMRSDTGTPISSFTTDGVDADTITAKDIRSATVARVLSEDVTVYVGASETGDGSGRDSNNKASSVARALNTALDGAVYFMRYPTVTVNVSGSINEMVRIRGLSGHGRILLTGDSTARIVGTIEGMNTSCLIEIDGIKVVNGEESANQLIIGNNATRMLVRNCSLDGYGNGYGIGANASNIHVIDCDFFRLDRALTASVNGNIHCHNSGGSNCQHVASAVYGGKVSLSGTRVAFNTALSLTGDGGTFIDDSTGINTKPYPGYIAPTWATKTVTFDADEIYTANVSNGYVWNRTEWRQGTWEGNGNAVRGYANFGSKVRDWLNSSGGYQGTPTITISAKRNASSGNKGNGAVSMMIGNPATLTLPAVPYGGGSSSATTGTALRNAIMTSSKLVLSSSTTSLANYGAFYDIKIKVTAQKKV